MLFSPFFLDEFRDVIQVRLRGKVGDDVVEFIPNKQGNFAWSQGLWTSRLINPQGTHAELYHDALQFILQI